MIEDSRPFRAKAIRYLKTNRPDAFRTSRQLLTCRNESLRSVRIARTTEEDFDFATGFPNDNLQRVYRSWWMDVHSSRDVA